MFDAQQYYTTGIMFACVGKFGIEVLVVKNCFSTDDASEAVSLPNCAFDVLRNRPSQTMLVSGGRHCFDTLMLQRF
jgi:hypothetical protein